jgi:uncharacterized protein
LYLCRAIGGARHREAHNIVKQKHSIKNTAKTICGEVLRNPVKALLVGLIRFYQTFISPGLGSRCKYYPSCSQYALDAVRDYGAARGFILAAWRLLRCNPFSYGGHDPVSGQRLFRPRQGTSASAERLCGHAPGRRHLVRG